MKKIFLSTLFLFAIIQSYANEHPRLFFGKEDLPVLRARQYTEVGREMITSMKELLVILQTDGEDGLAYNQALSAAMNGFLYLIEEKEEYAVASKDNITKMLETEPRWADGNLKGLNSYWMGIYVGFAYDFCYNSPSWDDAYKTGISQKLHQMAIMIADLGGTEQNTSEASNWQGNRGSSGALCFLACDESYDTNKLNNCINKVNKYVSANYGGEIMSRGWNIEGLGYLFYPSGNFIGPYGIAMDRLDPEKGLRKNNAFVNSYWTIYAVLSTALDLKGFGGLHPDFGDDNPHITGEGTFGQAFYYLPEEMKKAAKYWYDIGVGSGRKTRKHDGYRFGSVWAYMYYPDHLESVNPMEVTAWKEMFLEYTTDGCGYFTYRNDYKDGDDHIAQMYMKFRGNKGHNGPDALTYRILGQGAAWAVGGGRYGPTVSVGGTTNDVYWHLMNTIYPAEPLTYSISNPSDGKKGTNGNIGRVVGYPLLRENGSGHIVSEISANNVWTNDQKRWFVTDFDRAKLGVDVAYIIADSTKDGKFWQMVTTEDNAIQFYTNYFIITAPNGATMKGTVLMPGSNYRFQQKLSQRGSEFGESNYSRTINFQSDNGKYLVVLTVAPKGANHPTVKLVSGDYVNHAVVKIGAKEYTLTPDNVLYDKVNESLYPVPVWTFNNAGKAPLTVKFNASSSTSPDGKSLRFQYDFGDGTSSSEMSPSHTYELPGLYEAQLEVKSTIGKTRNLFAYILVKNSSDVTTALTKPEKTSYRINETVGFEATATASGNTIQKVEFLIDGTVVGTATSSPYTCDWIPQASGFYNASSRAYNNNGAVSESDVLPIRVNHAPFGAVLYPANGGEYSKNLPSITISTDVYDVDGSIQKVEFYLNDALVGTATAAPYEYTWNDVAEGSHQIYLKIYDNEGDFSVSEINQFTIADGTGVSSPIAGNILIYNRNGHLRIINNNDRNMPVEIINSLGHIIFMTVLQKGGNTIESAGWPDGVYIIQAEKESKKVLVNK